MPETGLASTTNMPQTAEVVATFAVSQKTFILKRIKKTKYFFEGLLARGYSDKKAE